MQHFEIKGQVREVGGKATIKALRKQGLVPCNLYGCGIDSNILFTVDAKELKGLTDTPASFIVDLSLDNGKKYEAVLHEMQWHPVSDACLHVDFLAVDDKKPISIKVPIEITGHAIGVQQGGKFFQPSRELRISALMANLPDKVTVDITSLGLEKKIKAGDIQIKDVVILSDKDTIICCVKTTRNVTADAAAAA